MLPRLLRLINTPLRRGEGRRHGILNRLSGLSAFGFCGGLLLGVAFSLPAETPTDYAAVDAIFSKHCLDCHASKDPEGQLVLESYESLMKGGEIGAAIVPRKSAESLLVKMVEGRFEKDGKKKIMPPGKRAKLSAGEIAIIKAWIDAGAPAP